MQTHNDADFLRHLKRRAEDMASERKSDITAGEPDEKELATWKASNGMHVSHRPDDPQKILRVSVGGGEHLPVTMNYCTIRGPVGQCIEMLEMALQALKECPE